MTKKLEAYKRTQEAKSLFRSFFDSDEDYLAFNLKYKVHSLNDKYHAYIKTLVDDGRDKMHSFEGKPSLVTYNSAYWHDSKCAKPWMTLDLSDQAEGHKLTVAGGKGEGQKSGMVNLAKQLGRQLKIVNRP